MFFRTSLFNFLKNLCSLLLSLILSSLYLLYFDEYWFCNAGGVWSMTGAVFADSIIFKRPETRKRQRLQRGSSGGKSGTAKRQQLREAQLNCHVKTMWNGIDVISLAHPWVDRLYTRVSLAPAVRRRSSPMYRVFRDKRGVRDWF